MAFDTIYAEGQRRYVESLYAYARQFLGQMDKPDVDYIEGLSPAIAIDQKSGSKNPRSTVGTVTEIYDYLRLLFARIGKPHCPKCGLPITQQTVQQIVDQVMSLEKGTRVQVLAPVIRGKKGEHKKVLDDIRKEGFTRVRVNGEVFRVDEDIQLDRYKMHTVEIVVDRLAIRDGIEQRLADSIELAMRHSSGIVVINVVDKEDLVFSERFACPECGISFEELTPRMFSFNSPYGACPECAGLGSKEEIDPELVLDLDKSIMEGALIPWRRSFDGTRSDFFANRVVKVCERFGIDINVPVRSLPPEHLDILLYGVEMKGFKFGYHNFAGDWVFARSRLRWINPLP